MAEIIFKIYQALKKSEKIPSEKEISPSSWVMTERLKMFE